MKHPLLALTEDPDAGQVLEASRIDLSRLNSDVSSHIGTRRGPQSAGACREHPRLAGAAPHSGSRSPPPAPRDAAGRSTAPIVLAAIVGEGRTVAAHMLRAQGLTFEEAIPRPAARACTGAASTASRAGTSAIAAACSGAPSATTRLLLLRRGRFGDGAPACPAQLGRAASAIASARAGHRASVSKRARSAARRAVPATAVL